MQVFFLLIMYGQTHAAEKVLVQSILVEGNKKTREALILREIDFQPGDSISLQNLADRMESNEDLLMNTGLFNEVQLNIFEWDTEASFIRISITVVESWYIYPVPIFELADRNLNVWWTEHDASFKRVNYGIRFSYLNFTGNKDNLKLLLQGGYLGKVLLSYERPYINRAKTIGLNSTFFFEHRREFPYETRYNKRQFYEDVAQVNLKTLKSFITLQYRPGVRNLHEIFVKYEQNKVTEDVLELNNDFFNGETTQKFFELSYTFSRERRDNRFYALKGNYLELTASKEGLGFFDDLNKFTTSAFYAHYFPILPKLNYEARAKVQVEWTGNRHPYWGLEALGFGEDFVRGYELYVVDGTDFFLSRNSLRLNLVNRVFDLGKIMPFRNYRNFPFTLWLSANADFGYVNNDLFNDDNPFNNGWLAGGGIGLDFIFYRKYVFQVDFSINHILESGVYLNVRTDF